METEDKKELMCETYVAAGAINIQRIEKVENLFPGSPEIIASVLGGKEKATKMKSPVEAVTESIQALVQQEILCQKQDFALLYKLELEFALLGVLSQNEYCDKINKWMTLDDSIAPTRQCMKAYALGNGTYPDWHLDGGLKDTLTSHIHAVAKGFIREMQQRGYYHPSLKAEKL